MPQDNWTEEDQKLFDEGLAAHEEWLKDNPNDYQRVARWAFVEGYMIGHKRGQEKS